MYLMAPSSSLLYPKGYTQCLVQESFTCTSSQDYLGYTWGQKFALIISCSEEACTSRETLRHLGKRVSSSKKDLLWDWTLCWVIWEKVQGSKDFLYIRYCQKKDNSMTGNNKSYLGGKTRGRLKL